MKVTAVPTVYAGVVTDRAVSTRVRKGSLCHSLEPFLNVIIAILMF